MISQLPHNFKTEISLKDEVGSYDNIALNQRNVLFLLISILRKNYIQNVLSTLIFVLLVTTPCTLAIKHPTEWSQVAIWFLTNVQLHLMTTIGLKLILILSGQTFNVSDFF